MVTIRRWRLSHAHGTGDGIRSIAAIMVCPALAAWLITFIGMAQGIVKGLLSFGAGDGKAISYRSLFHGGRHDGR